MGGRGQRRVAVGDLGEETEEGMGGAGDAALGGEMEGGGGEIVLVGGVVVVVVIALGELDVGGVEDSPGRWRASDLLILLLRN
jgi:hypothetical protein